MTRRQLLSLLCHLSHFLLLFIVFFVRTHSLFSVWLCMCAQARGGILVQLQELCSSSFSNQPMAVHLGFMAWSFGLMAFICRKKGEKLLADFKNHKFQAACCDVTFDQCVFRSHISILWPLKKFCGPLWQHLRWFCFFNWQELTKLYLKAAKKSETREFANLHYDANNRPNTSKLLEVLYSKLYEN